jgi:hypothetical protein
MVGRAVPQPRAPKQGLRQGSFPPLFEPQRDSHRRTPVSSTCPPPLGISPGVLCHVSGIRRFLVRRPSSCEPPVVAAAPRLPNVLLPRARFASRTPRTGSERGTACLNACSRRGGQRSKWASRQRASYLRASSYFRTAYIFLVGEPVDPRLVAAYRRHRVAFEAATLMSPAAEPIAIPYGAARLSLPGRG